MMTTIMESGEIKAMSIMSTDWRHRANNDHNGGNGGGGGGDGNGRGEGDKGPGDNEQPHIPTGDENIEHWRPQQ